jgi:hypothetical protein
MYATLRKLLLFTFCILFSLASCSEYSETVFEGPEHSAVRIYDVLVRTGLPSGINISDAGRYSITTSPGLAPQVRSVVSSLLSLNTVGCNTKSFSEKFFLPRRPDYPFTTSSPGATEEIILSRFKNIPDIFELSCGITGVSGQGSEGFVIWYDSSRITEAALSELIDAEIRKLGSPEMLSFILKDIRDMLKSENIIIDSGTSPSDSQLVVFSPFSFHIPVSEKATVGIQLMSTLLLFLGSGFIIGHWWARRY